MKQVIRIDERDFDDFKENFDARVEASIESLDMVRAQFIRRFASARSTLEKVDADKRKRAEIAYYATFYTLLKNPNTIPRITEDEMDRMDVKSFEDYIVVVQTWLNTMSKENSATARVIHRYSRLPKYLLYPTFVGALVLVFWNILKLFAIVSSTGATGHFANILWIVLGLDVAISSGRGIYYKLSNV